jgi:aflatoxin B1 aldehyde reductase
MCFYAYSPIAGGFLVKSVDTLLSGTDNGRFSAALPTGRMYNAMYGKPSLYAALSEWEDIASEAGCSKGELAYRWVVWNSVLDGAKGDAVIFGASRPAQAEESLRGVRVGALRSGTVQRIEGVWEKVKDEAPVDNYNSYAATL